MGKYCRSNLDRVWDTVSCLKHLFRINKPSKSRQPELEGVAWPGASALGPLPSTIPLARNGTNKRTLDVTIPMTRPNLLQEIHVRYQAKSGEVRYKIFYARTSVDDLASGAGALASLNLNFASTACLDRVSLD